MRTAPIVLALALIANPARADDPPREPRKVALVVGVSAYDHDFEKLNYAERDAEKLAEALRGHGFEVALLTGSAKDKGRATKANVEARLKSLLDGGGDPAKKIRNGDLLLMFFSGHGQQLAVKGSDQPFFCAVDSLPGKAETQVGISELVDDTVAPYGARNLLLIDACRDIPDPNKGKGVVGQDVSLKGQTAVLFSCRRGERSFEAKELQHGLFTHAVLGGLRSAAGKDGAVTWGRLTSHVQDEMESEELRKHLPKGAAQTPIATSGQVGRTVLVNPEATREARMLEHEYKQYLSALSDWKISEFTRDRGADRFNAWHALAKRGDARAMVLAGECIERGDGADKDVRVAFEWYRRAAEKENSAGMYILGRCYDTGIGAAGDIKEAVRWYRRAAEAGNVTAMISLGLFYRFHPEIRNSAKESAIWYRKAAEAGSARGMWFLSECYSSGSGVEKDVTIAFDWLRKASDAGDTEAIRALGYHYSVGLGVKQNPQEAASCYRKAANAGDLEGMCLLGDCYKEGFGVAKSEKEAIKWYRMAADKGGINGESRLKVLGLEP